MGYSIIALGQWLLDGYRSYGHAGFARASASWRPEALDVDLTGRNCIVTGANAGIGKEIALALARRKANVYAVCRDPTRGQAAVEQLRRDSAGSVTLAVVDVSDPASVRAFASDWAASGRPVHALVNNAGVLLQTRAVTEGGLEAAWATAMGGSFLLTALIAPGLVAGKGRVVNVSSGGAYTVKLDMADPMAERRKYDGAEQYAHAKRAQILLTEMWSQKFAGTGVTVTAMHPGWAETPGVVKSIPDFHEKNKGSLRSAAEGADTAVWLAASPEASDPAACSGKFFFDRKEVSAHKWGGGTHSPPADYEALWRHCEKAFGFVYEGSAEETAVKSATASGSPAQ